MNKKSHEKIRQEIEPTIIGGGKIGQKIGEKFGQEIGEKENGTKNWPKILIKKLTKNWFEKSHKTSEKKSNKNGLRRIKLTFIVCKVSQDKLNKNSRIGKVSKIS